MSTPANPKAERRRKRPAAAKPAARAAVKAEDPPQPKMKPAPADADGTFTAEEEAAFGPISYAEMLKDEMEQSLLRLEGGQLAKKELARKQGLIGEWQPEDISSVVDGVVDGTIQEPAPDLLCMEPSGRLLLYRGRVNGIHGHSNSGKSWTALLACKQQMDAGEYVFYFDYEDDAVSVISRLVKVLRVKPEVIKRLFIYVRPTLWFNQESVGRMLTRYQPALVVIDAMGGSLSMEGFKFTEDDDVTKWAVLVSGFIAKHGAAVLILDHLPKESPRNTLWPTGSQRKRAAITGAQYLQQMEVGFSKGQSGYSQIVCAKDRHGNYAEGEVVAHMKFDSVLRKVRGHAEPQPVTRISLVDPPPKELKEAVTFKKTATELCRVLAAGPLGSEETKKAFQGDNSNLGQVTRQLIAAGFIKIQKDGRKELRVLVKPYDGNWTPDEAALAGVEL